MPAIQVYIHCVGCVYSTMISFCDENKHCQVFTEVNFDRVQFRGRYVEQVTTAMESVLDEVISEIGIISEGYHEIKAVNMSRKKHITRDKLIGWVETLSYLMRHRAVPLLNKEVRVLDNVERLQEETIITLQNQFIEKQNEQLSSVQATVKV